MLRVFGALTVLCLSATCTAQGPAALSVPGVNTEVKKSVDFSGQTEGQYLVTDAAKAPIVAMRFSYGCGQLKTSQIFDALVAYGAERPIEYQQTWASTFGNPEIANCPGGVDAAIFADGRSEGEQQKVAEIYHERRGVYDGIAFVLPLLDAVVESEAQKPKALVEISNRLAEIGGHPTNDVSRLRGETFLLQVVADTLTHEQPMGIPTDMTKSGPAIEKVMNAEHLTHTSAAAYVIRRRLLVWMGDLVGNLGVTEAKRQR